MIKVNLFDFQQDAVMKLLDFACNPTSKPVITMKAPTGSGKTIMLISFIDEFVNNVVGDYAFVWLCPGKGDLEMQSYESMINVAPNLKSGDLFDALNNGFDSGCTTFINWELITKKGNRAITDGEKKNLYDRIDDAKRNGTKFILIIDEEHSNNTKKADDIISYFNAEHIIRVSATANKNAKYEFFEIDEQDVINEGLITRAIYVNPDIEDNAKVDEDYEFLIPLADKKRKEMQKRYDELGKNIRPLVLIQFPNAKPEYVKVVEKKLEDMGYTYENGLVSKWMSGQHKDLPENLTANDGFPVFLLMKQAISTGWDCPRAKILVKLRENMSEQFTIQTIGRIRRMPERMHYDDDILDFSYVYTFDEKYRSGLVSEMDKAYEVRRLFVKDKCKTFTLQKENRDLDYSGLGARDVLKVAYEKFKEEYKLVDDVDENRKRMENEGYVFGEEIRESIVSTKEAITENLAKDVEHKTIRIDVDTHKHSIFRIHNLDELKKIVHMEAREVDEMLKRLVHEKKKSKYKLIELTNKEYYAFIINNIDKLKEVFRKIVADMPYQKEFHMPKPKKSAFRIPDQDFFKYDVGVKDETDYLSNAYKNYTSGFVTSGAGKSNPEMMFEAYCEENDNVDWVYKNGDHGQQYMSVVYTDGIDYQKLFYPDYIVQTKDGSTWIIETKGGEKRGQSQNIDDQIKNKFDAFKRYAEGENINWGFVRDKDNKLYINNTEFSDDMNTDEWKPLKDEM